MPTTTTWPRASSTASRRSSSQTACWRSRSQMELAIVEYIAWFNNSRPHKNLDDRPPREIEELYAAKSRA
ncbi:MAG TPA: IS3 family transposase [Solirubrobacteraceae bacterium]|nr:IS3 family transposase [Solirubrobacteraceae bacterium]